MLLSFASHVPLLQCLTSFSIGAHKAAGKKFLVLLILTNLPVFIAAGLSPIPPGETEVLSRLAARLREAVTVPELFLYSAVYLTPVLYLIFERYSEVPGQRMAVSERLAEGFRGLFKGYPLVALLSILTLLCTAVAFSSLKVGEDKFKASILYHYLGEFSLAIYIFALFCWYLTLLDEKSTGDFVDTNRRDENSTAAAFAARVHDRGDEQ
jgi:hypothetical protein